MAGRVFRIDDYVTRAGEEARRSLHQGAVTDTGLWTIRSGEEIPLHVHPTSTTVWVVLRGAGRYLLAEGVSEHVEEGRVAIAEAGAAHGFIGEAEETLLLSVEAPRPVATSAP